MGTLDPSIYAALLRPPKSVQEYDDEAEQRESTKLAALLQRGQVSDQMQARSEQQRLQQLLRGMPVGATQEQRTQGLRAGGFWKEAGAEEKSALDRRAVEANIGQSNAAAKKSEVDADRERIANGLRMFEVTGQLLGGVTDQATYDIALQQIEQAFPQAAGKMPPNYDPARISQSKEQAQSVQQRLEQEWKAKGYSLEVRKADDENTRAAATNATSRANNAATVAQSERASVRADDRARDTATQKGAAPPKPMPGTAVKLQNEELSAVGTFAGIDADLGALEKQLKDGKLDLGLVGNAVGTARNYVGASSENSRNLATFKTKLENMRNSVLLLNKGVQTEGDAQRAMAEIMTNINDKDVVVQRLAELRALNRRAVDLRKNNVDLLRSNYGQEPMDFSKFENQPAAVNLGAQAQPFNDAEKERRYQEWKRKQGGGS